MSRFFAVLAFASLAGQDGGGGGGSDLLGRVEKIVVAGLPEADGTRRRIYVERLGGALMAARDPRRAEVLLQALPGAVEFHRHCVVARGVEPVDLPGVDPGKGVSVPLPAVLVQEGLDAHVEFLTGRIERSLARPDPEADRAAIAGQIDRLGDAMAAALQSKLPGEAGARFAKAEVDGIRDVWKMSLDLPLNGFLDIPLTEAQMRAVLEGVRTALDRREPVVLDGKDVADPKRPEAVAAAELRREVTESAFLACTLCYGGLESHERWVRDWDERVRMHVAAEAARLGLEFKPPGPSGAARGAPSTPPAGAHSPGEASGRSDSAEPSESRSAPPQLLGEARKRNLAVFLIVIASVLAVVYRKRMRGRAA